MKEIGGYFGLELAQKQEYHNDLIKLNSARNCLKYILKAKKSQKVYIPNYVCASIIESLEKLNIKYEFYNINDSFEIIRHIELKEHEKLLYVNYFALKSTYIKDLVNKYGNKLIIDNSQAFFEKPLQGIDTIYSPRKFFGVSDGGYLSTDVLLDKELELDEAYNSALHLLGRIDKSASAFYEEYQKAEQRLEGQPVKKMSKLTQKILSSIDYEKVQQRRKENFSYLQEALRDENLFDVSISFETVPFVYPLNKGEDGDGLRKHLIANKIYVAKYWNEVYERREASDVEKKFVEQIIPLPIDQRYDLDDMKRLVSIIKGALL